MAFDEYICYVEHDDTFTVYKYVKIDHHTLHMFSLLHVNYT